MLQCDLALSYGASASQELMIGMKYRLSRGFAAGSPTTSNVPLIDSMPPAVRNRWYSYPRREHCYANEISMTSYRSQQRYGKHSALMDFSISKVSFVTGSVRTAGIFSTCVLFRKIVSFPSLTRPATLRLFRNGLDGSLLETDSFIKYKYHLHKDQEQ